MIQPGVEYSALGPSPLIVEGLAQLAVKGPSPQISLPHRPKSQLCEAKKFTAEDSRLTNIFVLVTEIEVIPQSFPSAPFNSKRTSNLFTVLVNYNFAETLTVGLDDHLDPHLFKI